MAPNGNGVLDPTARFAALDERVTNLRSSLVNLEGEMRNGFNNLNATMAQISSEMRSSNKTQWPVIWSAIGVSFAIMAAVGSQALSPVRDNLMALTASLDQLQHETVPRAELNWRSERGAEDRANNLVNFKDLRETTVTRVEWMERNRARDNDLADLQRQLDAINTEVGSTYGVRDVIIDLKSQIQNMQRERTQ